MGTSDNVTKTPPFFLNLFQLLGFLNPQANLIQCMLSKYGKLSWQNPHQDAPCIVPHSFLDVDERYCNCIIRSYRETFAFIDLCHNTYTLRYNQSILIFSYLLSQLFLHVFILPIDCNNKLFFLEHQAHTFCSEHDRKHTFPK